MITNIKKKINYSLHWQCISKDKVEELFFTLHHIFSCKIDGQVLFSLLISTGMKMITFYEKSI